MTDTFRSTRLTVNNAFVRKKVKLDKNKDLICRSYPCTSRHFSLMFETSHIIEGKKVPIKSQISQKDYLSKSALERLGPTSSL